MSSQTFKKTTAGARGQRRRAEQGAHREGDRGEGRGHTGKGMEGRAGQGAHRAGGQRAEQGVSQERKPKRNSQTREDQQRGSIGDPHSGGPTNPLLCRPPILNQTTLQTKPGINIPSAAPCLLSPCSRWPLAFGGTGCRPSCSHCHCSSVIKTNSHTPCDLGCLQPHHTNGQSVSSLPYSSCCELGKLHNLCTSSG